MNKTALLKIAGILVVSFLVISVATFFLYPYLNEENYEKIQNERLLDSPPSFDDNSTEHTESNLTGGGQFAYLQQELQRQKQGDKVWEVKIDSLAAINRQLKFERDSVLAELQTLKEDFDKNRDQFTENDQDSGEADFIAASEEPREGFADRVKSLLNLDEEELKPIANQMSQQELVRIYDNSGNIQREKLLRSLSPERAAKLMREVML